MAGDWIKMRGELYSHPRFTKLYNVLIHDEDYGLLIYACGMDALELDVFPPNNKSVTERALQCVTERALRDVTMSALLRTWCAVNSHCKVDGMDAILSPMCLEDIDDIAGIEGFGEALDACGWVAEREAQTLVFPNFLEYNEPACLRQKPKSDAERAREYRARKRGACERVTNVTKRHGREEKRREEKSIDKNPPTPQAAAIPDSLNTTEFHDAWNRWKTYRKEIKKVLKPTTEAAQLKKLAAWGPEKATAAIAQSIEHGWVGLFEPTAERNGRAKDDDNKRFTGGPGPAPRGV